MAQLNITKTYDDGLILTEADLDNIKNDVETFLNVTKLSDDNLQDSGITASSKLVDASISTAKYANASVTAAKLAADAVGTASIADDAVGADELRDDASVDANRAVTTNHIRDNAITLAKMADDSVGADELRDDASVDANRAVTTNHIRDQSVTNDKITDLTITGVKLATATVPINKFTARTLQANASAGNVLAAGSSGTFSTASTSFVNVTNLSGNITIVHRPVVITLMQDRSTTDSGHIKVDVGANKLTIELQRDSVTIGTWDIESDGTAAAIQIPPSSIQYIDDPAGGTYNYRIRAKVQTAATSAEIFHCILVAYEI